MFNRFLPEKPIIENDDFVIYGNDDLDFAKEEIIKKLSEKKKEIIDFFGIENFPKVPINLFNDHEKYLDFTRQFYEPILYSYGNFTNGSINYTYNPEKLYNSFYNIVVSVIHEFVHLTYASIYKDKFERVVWLDEGLAQYLSEEYGLLEKDEKKFKGWYLDRIVRRDKVIPDMSCLKKHGNTFHDSKNNTYDGYDLSYLLVRYLIDNYDIKEILGDENRIRELESHILDDCISYYNERFKVSLIKDRFIDVETPEELMDYMDINTVYGWTDINGAQHVDTLKGLNFRGTYRIASLEETLQTGLGTCIEQAKMIKTFFDKIGLENKMFCYRNYETEELFDQDVKMHCFVLYHYNDSWYHFEHSNSRRRGIHKFDTIEEAINAEISRHDKTGIKRLTEISDIPSGLSFKEFNEYVNSFDDIKRK